ncbi:hypothetical protein [uncultured Corynebacterium sp.]|uniref:hypothetical protein n=1 Tax=uncultured Corynebacterium sp. TaxID=159447 RepID=UPI0026098234|nr:hypothetical protein [uncultured Corynebacterium sp.]
MVKRSRRTARRWRDPGAGPWDVTHIDMGGACPTIIVGTDGFVQVLVDAAVRLEADVPAAEGGNPRSGGRAHPR